MEHDQQLAELGAEQYHDEEEALRRVERGLQTADDCALLRRAMGHDKEQRNV